jgi:hypothetical protein
MKSMSFGEFLEYMVDGDVAAELVIKRMLDADKSRTVRTLNMLDELGIRGVGITKLNDECGYNIGQFFARVEQMKGKIKDPA